MARHPSPVHLITINMARNGACRGSAVVSSALGETGWVFPPTCPNAPYQIGVRCATLVSSLSASISGRVELCMADESLPTEHSPSPILTRICFVWQSTQRPHLAPGLALARPWDRGSPGLTLTLTLSLSLTLTVTLTLALGTTWGCLVQGDQNLVHRRVYC